MHGKRIRSYVLISASLAGCGGGAATERQGAAAASLVARGGNSSKVKRFSNGIARDGEDGVSSRRANIAIQEPIDTP